MPKKIAILGSTGSIGTQTLGVISQHPDELRATVLVAGSNVERLARQARQVRPALVVVADESRYGALRGLLADVPAIRVAAGQEAVCEAMARADYDTVVTATVGYSGLAPTLRAIEAGRDIALANKETLVVAGELVTERLKASPSRLIPVDSEHSAIYQCLRGEKPATVARLLVTASGGPFRLLPAERLASVTAADALHHPNWSMGPKITVDSATMLNKAFEIVEARWLFGIPGERIHALVHPQSIVHSMVEFRDGAVKAQLGTPDMKLPIRYALAGGRRWRSPEPPLALAQMATLTFEEVDASRFPCFALGHHALERGGDTACVVNAANEVAVDAFLRGRIRFTDIYRVIADTLEASPFVASPAYEDYVASNAQARARAAERVKALAL